MAKLPPPAEDEATSAGLVVRRRPISTVIAWSFAALCVAGVVIRMTVQDRYAPLAFVFYGLQLPVLAFCAAVVAIAAWRARWKRLSRVAILAMLGFVGWYFATSFYWGSPIASDNATRVLLWNTCRGFGGWSNVANEIAEVDADLVGLVESTGFVEFLKQNPDPRLADYNIQTWDVGITILARGEIRLHDWGLMSRASAFVTADVELPRGTVTLLMVDISSDPLLSREPAFEWLREKLDQFHEHPMIVMGDFNTPPDTAHNGFLRERCRNVFEVVGRGFPGTWPTPMPVLPLDQIWIDESIRPLSCKRLRTWVSDHRPVEALLEIGASEPTARTSAGDGP